MATAQGDIMIGSVKNMVDRLSKDFSANKQPMSIHEPRKNIFNKPLNPQVVATFAYKATQGDELSLNVGDILEVLEEIEDGWNKGRNIKTGDVGMYPTNFVEAKATPTTSFAVMREGHSEPEATKRAPSVVGILLPSMTTSAPIVSKPKEPSKPEEIKKTSHEEGKTKEMARVKFVYEPQHPDELKLGEVGALIEIVRKDCGDPGWFEGELNGKVGLFPDNFVELVPIGSTSGSPKTSAKVDTRATAKAPILAPTGSVAVPPAVPAKPKPKLTDTVPHNAAPVVPASKPVSSNFSDIRNRLAGLNMFAPGDPVPALSKSAIVSGSGIDGDVSTSTRPVSTYEIGSEALEQPAQLSHVTKDRPRGPGKRPVSMMPLKKKGSSENLLESTIGQPTTTSISSTIELTEKPQEPISQPSSSPSRFPPMKPVKEEIKDDNKPIFSVPHVIKDEQPVKVRSTTFSSNSAKVSPIPSGESDTVSRKEYNDVLARLAALEARLAALEAHR